MRRSLTILQPLLAAAAFAAALSGCSSLEPGSVQIVDRSNYSRQAQTNRTAAGSLPSPGTAKDSGRRHTIAPGDTVYNISVRYGLDSRQLMALNAITDPTQLRLGQVLRLPESVTEPRAASIPTGVRVSRVTEAAPVEDAAAKAAQSEPAAAPIAANAPKQGTKPAAAEAPEKAAPAIIPGAQMIWPVKGPILSDYAKNGKGLDIGGTEGSVVVAAAAGQVLYVSDSVKGYGNLVIVKHSPTVVTAYGHNSKVVVKANDQVKAGQKIAELGSTDAEQPMLRFEVRDKGKPVDPLKYLPPQR